MSFYSSSSSSSSVASQCVFPHYKVKRTIGVADLVNMVQLLDQSVITSVNDYTSMSFSNSRSIQQETCTAMVVYKEKERKNNFEMSTCTDIVVYTAPVEQDVINYSFCTMDTMVLYQRHLIIENNLCTTMVVYKGGKKEKRLKKLMISICKFMYKGQTKRDKLKISLLSPELCPLQNEESTKITPKTKRRGIYKRIKTFLKRKFINLNIIHKNK